MKFGKKGTDIIIAYIESSLKPVEEGEVLVNGDIATKGRIKRWFMDILEGQCPVIPKMKREDWKFVKWHYVDGLSWNRISQLTQIPESTLRYRRDRFFRAITETMPLSQGVEILQIHNRHKTDLQRQARWDGESK